MSDADRPPTHSEDEGHPARGAMFLMGLYVLALIGSWAWVYFIMAGRS